MRHSRRLATSVIRRSCCRVSIITSATRICHASQRSDAASSTQRRRWLWDSINLIIITIISIIIITIIS